jgi:Peptidase family S41
LQRIEQSRGSDAGVDLRGNGGGDAPLEEMSRWLDAGIVKTAQNPTRRLGQSCLYAALRWGYTEVSTAGIQPPISELLRQRLQQEVDGLMQPSPEGCPVVFEEHKSEWNYRRHKLPAKARVLVLVDNRCASDCELMVYAFAAAPGTVIAGVNTYGMAQYIQPGYFLLPHSRLPFRIALGISDLYGDGRSVDGYGLDVDVLLPGELDQSAERITRLAKEFARREIPQDGTAQLVNAREIRGRLQ